MQSGTAARPISSPNASVMPDFQRQMLVMEEIEYHPDRKLDKTQLTRFSTCKYIDDGRHIILSGACGSGKTYIACALGNAACRKFKKVRYVRLPELLEELNVAKGTGEFRKTTCFLPESGSSHP